MDRLTADHLDVSTRRLICTLGPTEAEGQLNEWVALHEQAHEVDEIEAGVRMRFPASLSATIRDLAAREATCCSFLTLTVDESADQVTLAITSDDPQGRPVAGLLAGLNAPDSDA